MSYEGLIRFCPGVWGLYTHDIHLLFTRIEDTRVHISDAITKSERLTMYTVQTRYPGYSVPIEERHYLHALSLSLAELGIAWSAHLILMELRHH